MFKMQCIYIYVCVCECLYKMYIIPEVSILINESIANTAGWGKGCLLSGLGIQTLQER